MRNILVLISLVYLTSGECETMVHGIWAMLYFHQDWVVLQMDICNAFNLVSWSFDDFMHDHPHCIFLRFSTWGFHSHFIDIKYMIEGPIGRNVVCSGSPSCSSPYTTTHHICVFILLVDDTHIIGFTLDVVFVFFMITTWVFSIETFNVVNEMCSLVSIGVGPLYITFFWLSYFQFGFLYFKCISGIQIICWVICG